VSGQGPSWAHYRFQNCPKLPLSSGHNNNHNDIYSRLGLPLTDTVNHLTPKEEIRLLRHDLDGNTNMLCQRMRYFSKRQKDFYNEMRFNHPNFRI